MGIIPLIQTTFRSLSPHSPPIKNHPPKRQSFRGWGEWKQCRKIIRQRDEQNNRRSDRCKTQERLLSHQRTLHIHVVCHEPKQPNSSLESPKNGRQHQCNDDNLKHGRKLCPANWMKYGNASLRRFGKILPYWGWPSGNRKRVQRKKTRKKHLREEGENPQEKGPEQSSPLCPWGN